MVRSKTCSYVGVKGLSFPQENPGPVGLKVIKKKTGLTGPQISV